jgi:hypothetical protein
LQFGCIQMAASITERHDHRRQGLSRRVTLGAFNRIVAFDLTPRASKTASNSFTSSGSKPPL